MSKREVCFLLPATLAVVLAIASGQSVSRTTATVTTGNAYTPASVSSTVQPPIALSTEDECRYYNSCGVCIQHWECYYCDKDNSCRLYPAAHVLPAHCPLDQVRWGISCSITFLAIVITAGVIVGVLLLALCCCCYCCCCRKSRRRGYTRLTGGDFDVTFHDRDIQLNLGDRQPTGTRAARTTRTTNM
ncbi:PREDICTED: pituitary tumor-transforming gene 1 protein-interacting protein-like [Branchiostoma belcheri]|uniref:Pituitary tumor-transforming gene 1 protein-interacting protein-like n=1 Tax=Branchiostoma belcheri TaxID=7741 RepID=A0A6P5A3Q0_BRABE|nr:PREDICTED: pituitary tumor-transforming gene 1 protein-interacting protein-like [Branchiostoma belcheri]